MDKSSTTRFSDRVDNYAKYRPSYPKEMMDWFKSDEVGLTPEYIIADVGSGTGISTKLFLEAGCTVYGVEPNAPMRERAEQELAVYEKFISIDGTAEDTTLPFDSVDLIICCQAFHWFDVDKAREEFKRILKSPDSEVFLIWNERTANVGMKDYDQILVDYGTDYKLVRHSDAVEEKNIAPFFGGDHEGNKGYEIKEFRNIQEVDLEALKGRIFSSSYMPNENEATPELIDAIQSFFDKHQKDEIVELEYVTRVYRGRI
jgi:SAM-dependent methyltransferase